MADFNGTVFTAANAYLTNNAATTKQDALGALNAALSVYLVGKSKTPSASLNDNVVKVCQDYLNTTASTSFNDLVMRALRAYLVAHSVTVIPTDFNDLVILAGLYYIANGVVVGTDNATALGPKTFLFGVWNQHPNTHASWKARRINTLIAQSAGFVASNEAAYNASALANNLWQMRGPGTTGAADKLDSTILTFTLQDEPDGAGNQTPAQLAVTAAADKVIAPAKPVSVNMLTANIALQQANAPTTAQPYLDYFALSDVNWFSGDTYPSTTHNQDTPATLLYGSWNIGANQTYLSSTVGGATANMYFGPYRTVTPGSAGKAVFQYFGTGHVDLGNPNPKVSEPSVFRFLVWSSIINGAAGVFLFPQCVGSLPVTGSISTTVLTVTATGWYDAGGINRNKIYTGLQVSGTGVTASTVITGQLTSTEAGGILGGTGTYSVNNSQTVTSKSLTLTSPAGASGDDSDPSLLTELQTVIDNVNVMQGLGDNLLIDTVLGGRKAFTVWHSDDYSAGDPNTVTNQSVMPVSAGSSTKLPRGFEGATFVSGGVTYFLLMNMMNTTRTFPNSGTYAPGGANPWNVTGMSFAKYEVKLFTNLSQTNLFSKAGIDD